MALLKVRALIDVYELSRVTDGETRILERLNSDDEGARMLLARLHQELDTGADGSGVALADDSDRLATLRLRDVIEAEENAGHTLKEICGGTERTRMAGKGLSTLDQADRKGLASVGHPLAEWCAAERVSAGSKD